MPRIIAIDGPAGAGKSTIARTLAELLGSTYIDTGAMYRAVALRASRGLVGWDDAAGLERHALAARIEFGSGRRTFLDGEDVSDAIRTPEVSSGASKVAAVGPVRAALVAKQRLMAESLDVVMEGRDIGTVVFPAAQVKIFLDADPLERARRRAAETPGVAVEELARQIAERDARDSTRAESPLVQAADAVRVDTTGLTIDQVVAGILQIVKRKES
jgi:cytidylate kinase